MYKSLLFFCLSCSLSVSAQKNDALVLTHITVIDCTGAPAQPNSTVMVAQGRITAVGPSDTIKILAIKRVVDATGKFLIPGLWDIHGHLTDATEDAFPLLIMNGVTGCATWAGTSLNSIAGARKSIAVCKWARTSSAPGLSSTARKKE